MAARDFINGMHLKVGDRFGKVVKRSHLRASRLSISCSRSKRARSLQFFSQRKNRNYNPPIRALCHELVLGVLRWQLWLDKIVEHYAKRSHREFGSGCSHRAATRSLSTSFFDSHSRVGGGQ